MYKFTNSKGKGVKMRVKVQNFPALGEGIRERERVERRKRDVDARTASASAADNTSLMIFHKQLLLATSFPLSHPTSSSRLF